MVAVPEPLAKRLLKLSGMSTPRGSAARSVAEAEAVSRDLGLPLMAKAVIAAGKKGKFGAVKHVTTMGSVATEVAALLGATFRGYQCDEVLLEEFVDIKKELFVSIMFDELGRCPLLLLSAKGGVDVEDERDSIVSIPIAYKAGIHEGSVTDAWLSQGLSASEASAAAKATVLAYEAFKRYDATLLEINPMAITAAGIVAVGVLMAVDDGALFRQPEIAEYVLAGSGRFGRSPNPLETHLLEAAAKYDRGSIRFMAFPGGDLGSLIWGGGASLYAADLIIDAGGRLANYYDASSPDPELEKEVIRSVLRIPGLRGLIFGSNILSHRPVVARMQRLVEVLLEENIDATKFPVVAHLNGTGAEEARKIAATVPGLNYLGADGDLDDAIDRFVELTLAHRPTAS